MTLSLNITKIVVLQGQGADKVCMNVDKPSGCWPYHEDQLSLSFDTAQGKGPQYLIDQFQVKPEDIEIVKLAGHEKFQK